MTGPLGNLICGEWTGATDAASNLNPSDLSDVVGDYAQADAHAVAHAVAAAKGAFPSWSQASPQARFDLLDRAGSLLLERRASLGELLSREEGKTLPEAVGEVVRSGQIMKFHAGEALRMTGDLVASVRPDVDVEVWREPVGVVGLVTPWNFPMAIPAWKIAPALAYGNTVVLKPAELTPGSAWALASILQEAGAPPGVVNLVMGSGATAGRALVESSDVDAISFTGSVTTGRAIAGSCASAGKRVQCEMGGKNPMVVLDDADLEVAVEVCLNGAFFSTGQRCTASSRLIVTEGTHDRFVDALTQRMRALRVGHALDPTTQIGPVVDQRQLDQNLSYLEVAEAEGAKVVGGELVERDTRGFFLEPALLLETSPTMRVNQEEIFGPVASVIRVRDYEEALEVANGVRFGLSAGICTTSLKHARHFKHHARAGMVMINLPTAGVDHHAPFGGTKGSSFGPREQGQYARDFYTAIKTCYAG